MHILFVSQNFTWQQNYWKEEQEIVRREQQAKQYLGQQSNNVIIDLHILKRKYIISNRAAKLRSRHRAYEQSTMLH